MLQGMGSQPYKAWDRIHPFLDSRAAGLCDDSLCLKLHGSLLKVLLTYYRRQINI
jgi:hypothetical protein